jgi:hypothetical protein
MKAMFNCSAMIWFYSMHGNQDITKYWDKQLTFIKDIELSMQSLEGTKELLYETGVGKTLLIDPKGGACHTF